jgi:hypothetical protein
MSFICVLFDGGPAKLYHSRGDQFAGAFAGRVK